VTACLGACLAGWLAGWLQELAKLAEAFVDGAEAGDGTHEKLGFPSSCYGVSKMLTIRYSQLLAAEAPDGVLVNAMCPGFVTTDMTRGQGDRAPAEGAATAVELATLPTGAAEPRGAMLRDMQEVGWRVK
jgi:NAD(P)-dependent dehydrogenase (short-subunit alcohol dehydrogenase family)